MDGKGRWVDNVIVERLWRGLKYEEVYLKAYETPKQAEFYWPLTLNKKLGAISNFTMKDDAIKVSITKRLMKSILICRNDWRDRAALSFKKPIGLSNR